MTPPHPMASRPAWKSSPYEGEAPPTNNLWIGNLGPEVSEADLTELFGKYGQIESITYYSSRSYAFVHFKRIEDAKAAKNDVHGTLIGRNPIKIDFAKPAKPCKSLWVSGISQSVSKDELEEEFNMFGKIQEFKFLRDRSTAFVDYFRMEDASQALKSMNGKRIGVDVLRVDFLRSQPSRREQGADYRDTREGQFPNRSILPTGARWMLEDSFKSYPDPVFDERHQFFPSGGRNGEGQPSKVLCIRYPPSVTIDELSLHNAMILFGEIESMKTYEDRNFAYVQFRSVDEARLAKQGLQGKLFGNSGILIEYSNNEFAPPNEAFGSYADPNGPISDMLSSEHPMRLRGVKRRDGILRPPGSQGGYEPGYTNTELDGNRHTPLEGSHVLSSGPCDLAYATRESKRLRVDYDAPLPPKGVDERLGLDDPRVTFEGRKHLSPLNNRSFVTGLGLRRPDNDWRGVIAKGGTPICRARCVPFGEGIGSEIPDVVNCTARTGLDMLTKHYADAVGFRIVFFLPDSEADFAPYTEFLRYLESKSRAGVAKFEDGTTLFLVPPSDFLTCILKVAGPERLYGVVLEFPQTAPIVASNQQPKYVGLQSQNNTCQTGYDEMPQDENTLQRNYNRIKYDGVKAPLKTRDPPNPVPPVNSSTPVTKPAVPLTPELIATLTSLLPAGNELSGTKNSFPEATSSTLGPTINIRPNQEKDQVISQTWIDKHQLPEHGANPAHLLSNFPSQAQFAPQDHLAYQSSPASQMPVGYYQGKDHVFNLQPSEPASFSLNRHDNVVSSRAATSAIPLHHGQLSVSPHLDQQSDRISQGTDPSSFFGSSSVLQQPSNAAGTLVSGTGSSYVPPHLQGGHMALASEADMKNQNHHLNFAMHGVGPEVAETEDEKNRRYQTTLQFAANLLSKIQQPPE